MKATTFRNLAFYLHRYVGLLIGIVLVIVGLTGSILVFQKELDRVVIGYQFGHLVPQPEPISLETVIANVTEAYRDRPELRLSGMGWELPPDLPLRVDLESPDEQYVEVMVDRYTGEILGDRQWEKTFFGIVYKLHYELLAGQPGIAFVGIVALLLFLLCVTGLILWPGWRKLGAGFNIKWNAHPKRVNFDVHKVAGIVTTIFLAAIAFTGFCWNFYDQTEPAIYAATFTAKPIEPKSQVILDRPSLGIDEILRKAGAALPGAKTTSVSFPLEADGTFHVYKQFPHQHESWRNEVNLDRYTGEVIRIRDSRSLPLGDVVLDAFVPLHYGTFGGIATRILYVFVGLSPILLFATGFVMYRYRYRAQSVTQQMAICEPQQRAE